MLEKLAIIYLKKKGYGIFKKEDINRFKWVPKVCTTLTSTRLEIGRFLRREL